VPRDGARIERSATRGRRLLGLPLVEPLREVTDQVRVDVERIGQSNRRAERLAVRAGAKRRRATSGPKR
jgi:hypothetical protein